MKSKITKIDIITKASKLEELKEALNEIGITGMTVSNVLGCGMQKGRIEGYKGTSYSVDLLPKIKIEVVVSKISPAKIIDVTKEILGSNEIGSGKIFVYPVENVIRIRTGEEGESALN